MSTRQYVAVVLLVIALACACVVIRAEELRPQSQCQQAAELPVIQFDEDGVPVPAPIDPCEMDWVRNSAFWSWFYNCKDSAGGGSSGAG